MTGRPKTLQEALREKDDGHPRNRLFVMGCGRSGTWLLAGVMTTFQDTFVLTKETPVTAFLEIDSPQSVHVVKRSHDAYLTVNLCPPEIGIVSIVRHPFDVLTSHNPVTGWKYHIAPERWMGEMQALRWLVDTQRPKTKIVRYEDLVARPDEEQQAIADFFGLKVRVPAREYQREFQPADGTRIAMHGLRPPDVNSVGRWKKNPEDRAYIAGIAPSLHPLLDWVSQRFGYDVSLT